MAGSANFTDEDCENVLPVSGPLDRPTEWTEFPDQWAKSKVEHVSTFRQLARRVIRTRGRSKDDLPWLKLAKFGQDRSAKGSLRNNGNMRAITGVELDYDDGDVTWDQAWARLYEARLPALLYTTRRHSSDQPRFRVMLPTSRPLPPEARAQLVARAYGVIRGTVDGASFTPSQSFYYGVVDGGRITVELPDPPSGRFIDLADDLDATALDKNGRPWIAEELGANDNAEGLDDAIDDEFGDLHTGSDIERISAALKAIPFDERDTWLIVGQSLHHEFSGDEEGFELWDEWSQPSAKYDDADQRRVWESFGSYRNKPRTIATLYKLAGEFQRKVGRIGNLRFLTTEDCRRAPSRGYIVKGLIAPGDVICIFGPPGAGKSLIAPHIGFQVALGEPAFGRRTKPGLVFYIAAEDPHGMQNRVAALTIRQGHSENFYVVEGVSDLFSIDSPDLDALIDAVNEREPALIVIDTLAIAFPGLEENDSGSMGRAVHVARQLTLNGAAVILIHHDTKAEGSTPRGHSVLNGALDMALHVKRNDEGIARGRLTKNRNGSTDFPIAFRIGVEELGRDEDGDPITAALAEVLTGNEAAQFRKLPAAQQAALAILEELEAEGPVTNERWTQACVEGSLVSQSENAKSRRDCFSRARRELARAGLIELGVDGVVRSKSSSADDPFSDEEDI